MPGTATAAQRPAPSEGAVKCCKSAALIAPTPCPNLRRRLAAAASQTGHAQWHGLSVLVSASRLSSVEKGVGEEGKGMKCTCPSACWSGGQGGKCDRYFIPFLICFQVWFRNLHDRQCTTDSDLTLPFERHPARAASKWMPGRGRGAAAWRKVAPLWQLGVTPACVLACIRTKAKSLAAGLPCGAAPWLWRCHVDMGQTSAPCQRKCTGVAVEH